MSVTPVTPAGDLPLVSLTSTDTLLVEKDGNAARASQTQLKAFTSNSYASRASLVSAISAGSLDGLVNGDLVEFNQSGLHALFYKSTGATAISDMPGYLPAGDITTLHWGAGLGTSTATNDTAAVQAMVNYATGLGRTWHIVGTVYIHSTVTISGVPRMRSTWGNRIIQVDGNYPVFTVAVTGTMTGIEVVGIRAECNAASANTGNGFMRFTGPNTALLQRGRVENNHLSNFYYGFDYALLPRTTGFGREGGVNWMNFSDNHYLNIYRPHYFTRGCGTGNCYTDEKPAVRIGGAYYEVIPETAGSVMGDLIFKGIHCNGNGGNATFLRVAAGTVYGAQVSIIGCQFDANLTVPISLPVDHTFENFVLSGNNWGGSTELGANITPLRSSIISDRDVSKWEAGNVKSSTFVGAVTEVLFNIHILEGGALFRVELSSGDIPGIGAAYAVGEYWVTYDAGGAVVTERSKERSSIAAGALDISFISVTPTIARVRALYTKTAGTARIHGNITGRGESAFKIVRA